METHVRVICERVESDFGEGFGMLDEVEKLEALLCILPSASIQDLRPVRSRSVTRQQELLRLIRQQQFNQGGAINSLSSTPSDSQIHTGSEDRCTSQKCASRRDWRLGPGSGSIST